MLERRLIMTLQNREWICEARLLRKSSPEDRPGGRGRLQLQGKGPKKKARLLSKGERGQSPGRLPEEKLCNHVPAIKRGNLPKREDGKGGEDSLDDRREGGKTERG